MRMLHQAKNYTISEELHETITSDHNCTGITYGINNSHSHTSSSEFPHFTSCYLH